MRRGLLHATLLAKREGALVTGLATGFQEGDGVIAYWQLNSMAMMAEGVTYH